MTLGEHLGLIAQRATSMLHSAMAGFVDATGGTSSGDQMHFSLQPSGLDMVRWTADMVEECIGALGSVTLIPHLGADLAKLFAVLLS